MRKVMALVLAIVLVFALASMSVSARTLTAEEKALFDELREHIAVADGDFVLPEDVITQGENYLASLSTALTPAQIAAIKAEVDAAKAIVVAEKTGVAADWSETTKAQILEHIDNAAEVVGCSATADAATGEVVIKNAAGQTVVANDELVKKTGFGAEGVAIAALCTAIVLGACAFVSKKVELF
jgi:DNA replication initiation complex subunit (GINS family)